MYLQVSDTDGHAVRGQLACLSCPDVSIVPCFLFMDIKPFLPEACSCKQCMFVVKCPKLIIRKTIGCSNFKKDRGRITCVCKIYTRRSEISCASASNRSHRYYYNGYVSVE